MKRESAELYCRRLRVCVLLVEGNHSNCISDVLVYTWLREKLITVRAVRRAYPASETQPNINRTLFASLCKVI
jgi:hypothetical protein